MIGPEGDPEGWKVLPPVKVTGTVFDTRKVEVECTVCNLSRSAQRIKLILVLYQLAVATPVRAFNSARLSCWVTADGICSYPTRLGAPSPSP